MDEARPCVTQARIATIRVAEQGKIFRVSDLETER